MAKNHTENMTVLEHIGELRNRIIVIVVAFIIAVVFSFTQADYIRHLIASPIEGFSLVYFSPPEAFMANLRIAVMVGIFLVLPVIIYEILAFLFPGLYKREKKFAVGVSGGILFFFVAGVLFAYFVVMQLVLQFFLGFQTAQLSPTFNVSNYISFVFNLLLVFGLFFQLPVLFWVLGKMGLITADTLKSKRKYAILIMLGAAALITPPDVISQVILIGPLFVLYELGVWAVVINERKKTDETAA